ncbi:MAG: protein phosphatase CheZ [Nevskia sp.]|nr:protein phosphatase CheZ [Nevskia sp.]
MNAPSRDHGGCEIHDPAELYAGVARLTRCLHEGLRELGLDSRLARVAGSDIPDACTRLDCVVKMTEDAAHRTLDLVEGGRGIADGLADVREHLTRLQARPAAPVLPIELRGAQVAVEDAETRLRETLTALAQAQEYQDISGQLIRRVIGLVRNAESTLLELLSSGQVQSTLAPPIHEPDNNLPGPAVPNSGAADQDDADRLLSSLGF